MGSALRLTDKQAGAVASGRKTTHRLQAANRGFPTGDRMTIFDGDSIACYVELTGCERGTLCELSRAEAQAEGYGGARGPLMFREGWLRRHDRSWCGLRDATERGLTDEAAAARFLERHTGAPILILTWRLCEEPERFLCRPVPGKQGDYTGSAARSFDPLPVTDPSAADVARAQELGEQQRTSFLRDLRAERSRRKAVRGSNGPPARARESIGATPAECESMRTFDPSGSDSAG